MASAVAVAAGVVVGVASAAGASSDCRVAVAAAVARDAAAVVWRTRAGVGCAPGEVVTTEVVAWLRHRVATSDSACSACSHMHLDSAPELEPAPVAGLALALQPPRPSAHQVRRERSSVEHAVAAAAVGDDPFALVGWIVACAAEAIEVLLVGWVVGGGGTADRRVVGWPPPKRSAGGVAIAAADRPAAVAPVVGALVVDGLVDGLVGEADAAAVAAPSVAGSVAVDFASVGRATWIAHSIPEQAGRGYSQEPTAAVEVSPETGLCALDSILLPGIGPGLLAAEGRFC